MGQAAESSWQGPESICPQEEGQQACPNPAVPRSEECGRSQTHQWAAGLCPPLLVQQFWVQVHGGTKSGWGTGECLTLFSPQGQSGGKNIELAVMRRDQPLKVITKLVCCPSLWVCSQWSGQGAVHVQNRSSTKKCSFQGSPHTWKRKHLHYCLLRWFHLVPGSATCGFALL